MDLAVEIAFAIQDHHPGIRSAGAAVGAAQAAVVAMEVVAGAMEVAAATVEEGDVQAGVVLIAPAVGCSVSDPTSLSLAQN